MPPDDVSPDELPPGAADDFPPGAPADQLLEIRSDDGAVLDFSYINLNCIVAPDKYREKMQQDLGLSRNSKEMWWLTASS